MQGAVDAKEGEGTLGSSHSGKARELGVLPLGKNLRALGCLGDSEIDKRLGR